MSLDRVASEAAERCTFCPKMCSAACPVSRETSNEALTPWGKMTLLSATVETAREPLGLPGRLEVLAQKARALFDGAGSRPLDADGAEAFYACTGCLRCRSACEHGTDVPAALSEGRAHAVTAGVAPAAARSVADRFARHGHAASGDIDAALDPVERAHPAPARATSVLFAGCEAPLSAPRSVSAALSAAKRLRAPMALVRGLPCCGRPLYEAGYRDAFAAHLRRVWAQLGAREVVVLSAACARALGSWGREVGVEPQGPVVHATTYLARRLGPELQGAPLPWTVAYHDPCHLGRGLGEYEAPRRLLNAALAHPVEEAAQNRQGSDCCGSSGLLPRTFPEAARSMAMSRADALRATGAPRVATACPACRESLAAAGLDVLDVVEVFEAWLAGADVERS
jgi:Fe-S oxidoreductase